MYDKKNSIYGMYANSILDMTKYLYSFGMDDFDDFEKNLTEHLADIARNNMGGSEGIHKPTSGNPDRLRR
jgi:hypothetical protein